MARSRREFLTRGLISLGALSLGPEIVTRVFQRSGHPSLPHGVDAAGIELKGQNDPFLKEAMFYKKLDNLRIECQLCPRKCRIADLERGYCGVRENRDGTYYTLVHSRPCSINADPIEKKPLFHFLPGTTAFSIATAGCNIECLFCQNWQISQFRPEQVKNYHLTPGQIANAAVQEACRSIAYTYSEPVIFYEYMYDTAIAGNPKKRPSMAAATVPEYSTSSPRLAPELTPATTISGSTSSKPVMARWTQSVGVPST